MLHNDKVSYTQETLRKTENNGSVGNKKNVLLQEWQEMVQQWNKCLAVEEGYIEKVKKVKSLCFN
jgi:hypothetical protein